MDAVAAILQSHGDTLGIGALLVAVLGVLLRSLATGKLIFRAQLEEMRSDKDAEAARILVYYELLIANLKEQIVDWRGAYGNEAKAREAQAKTLEELLELARAGDHILRSLPARETNGD